MSWTWFSQLSDAFKKRVGKYLINRYLGPFLEEGILLNQLSVDGPIRLKDVALNTSHINAFLEDSEIPLEFIDGYIQELSVTVPMANLLRDNCLFEINGLTLTLQVKKRSSPTQIYSSIFFSMYESFSSLNVAEDCLKQNDVTDSPGRTAAAFAGPGSPGVGDSSVLGVELLAEAIDSIIQRVQVLLFDTTIRLEYVPTVAPKGLALELRIGKISYAGEAINPNESLLKASTIKKISFEDVGIFSDEFSFRREYVTPDRDSDDQESDFPNHKEDRQPLKLGSLTGRHELVVRFADTNHFGLPRSLEEVELNLGGILFHLFPHQIHTVVELSSALAAAKPNKDSLSARRMDRDPPPTLESVLQQSMILEPVGLRCRDGWSSAQDDDLTTRSTEFVAMPKLGRRQRPLVPEEKNTDSQSPRIVVRAASLLASLVELDEGVSKLGGESTKTLALDKMHEMAAIFFKSATELDSARFRGKLVELADELIKKVHPGSQIQIVCSPISVVHEEGKQDSSVPFPDDFSSKTSVVFGQMLARELLWPLDSSLAFGPCKPEVVPILQFDAMAGSNPYHRPPDFRLVLKDSLVDDGNTDDSESSKCGSRHSTISLNLNPCTINFDPGFVDRTFMLFNYAELDPCCLVTPDGTGSQLEASDPSSSLLVNIVSPRVLLNFYVPRADMRNPPDISIQEFIQAFWSRSVHPEIFQIDLGDVDLTVTRDSLSSPIIVALGTNRLAVNFQENSASEKLPLIVARKSSVNQDHPHKRAALITVTIQMSEMSEESIRRISFRESAQPETTFFGSSTNSNSDGPCGATHKTDQRASVLRQALEHGRSKNNLSVDLKFDDLSIVLPNKHAYELVYNRLGNDLLLWTPVYLRVKQYLFHRPVSDPLRDPDAEFSYCISGIGQRTSPSSGAIEMHQSSENLFDLFPKPSSPGLSIHTDTFVSLSVSKGFVAICSKVESSEEFSEFSSGHFIFSAILTKVELETCVGLERSPDVCLLSVAIRDGTIAFGRTTSSILNVRGIHFNPRPAGDDGSQVLLGRTHWHQFGTASSTDDSGDLLQLASKILFDSKANLKTIDLTIDLREMSISWNLAPTSHQWINWLVDFFTVVEYPVVGYIPPAILTEMRFDLRHCTLDVSHTVPPGKMTLALGRVGVHCSLLDTGRDVNIGVSLEDASLFTSRDPANHMNVAVCVADLDYLDLNVSLREVPRQILDVSASCNLLRLRTCADTIAHLAEVANAVVVQSGSTSSSAQTTRDSSVEPSDMPSVDKEDLIPDLADAMAELDAAKKGPDNCDEACAVPDGKSVMKNTKKRSAQVFFFPDESHRLSMDSSFPDGLGMTESFHESRMNRDHDTSDDSLEGFCILDAIGTGFSKNGEATVQHLDDSPVIFVENHFPIPEKSIDYLKAPQVFPPFQSRITLKRLSVLWQIFGGKDLTPATSFTLIGGGSSGDRSLILSRSVAKGGIAEILKTRGGPHRIENQLIEVHLSQLSMQHEVYPETCAESSRQIVIVKSFEVHDRLASSDINKLLHLYSSQVRPKQSNANMFSLKCVNLRPDDGGRGPVPEETNVSVSLQPLRLNIDQDTLLFVVEFFSSLFPSLSPPPSGGSPVISATASNSNIIDETRGMTIRYSKGTEEVEIDPTEIGEEISEDFETDQRDETVPKTVLIEEPNVSSDQPSVSGGIKRQQQPYIRTFIFSKDVPIRIDYSSKYLDLSQGALAGLLTGLTSLNCSELTLKKVCYRNGIVGLEKLFTLLVTDWLTDIRQNQIPQILGGVGPMHSVLQLLQGIKDLVLMPVEQYQKDGRILRGLQRGAHSFTSSTAMSLLDFTNRVLGVIKFAAELAFDIMSPESAVVQGKLPHPAFGRRRPANAAMRRPNDVREGVFNAFAIVQEGFDETARSLAQAVALEHSRRGLTGAVGGILRQVPSNLVRPVILATSATTNVLEGVKCHVAPGARKDEEDKWKQSS